MVIDYDKIKKIYYRERDELASTTKPRQLGQESYYAYWNKNTQSTLLPRVCFGEIRSTYINTSANGELNVELHIFTELKPYERSSHLDIVFNNVTWMSIEQLREHIGYVKDHIGIRFKYSVSPLTEYSLSNFIKSLELSRVYGYKILINCKKEETTTAEFKFLLFWIRLAYKYPQNILLADMYTLQKELKGCELYNLITIPRILFNYYDENFLSLSLAVSLDYLKKQLKSNSQIDDIFKGKGENIIAENKYSAPVRIPLSKNFGMEISPENILENADRFDIYKNIYNYLNEHR